MTSTNSKINFGYVALRQGRAWRPTAPFLVPGPHRLGFRTVGRDAHDPPVAVEDVDMIETDLWHPGFDSGEGQIGLPELADARIHGRGGRQLQEIILDRVGDFQVEALVASASAPVTAEPVAPLSHLVRRSCSRTALAAANIERVSVQDSVLGEELGGSRDVATIATGAGSSRSLPPVRGTRAGIVGTRA